jgi:hypothetical protein
MGDSLHDRGRNAIEEHRRLRAEALRLGRERLDHVKALQLAILESAMLRTEIKAYRDDKEAMDNQVLAARDRSDDRIAR